MQRKKPGLDDLFTRGVGGFIDPEGKFKEKIEKKLRGEYKQDIVIKFGVDPTRPDIHLGHAVVLRKLRKFQDLGCKVVFLVGDFTAHIGDPTGKSKVRPEIDQQEIEANMKTYLEQVGKILLLDKTVFSWIRNSDWFLSVEDIFPGPDAKVEQTIQYKNETIKINLNPKSFIGKAALFEETRMQKSHLNKSEILVITLRGLLWTLRHTTHARLLERDMFQERIKKGEELYMHEMLYPVLQGIDSHVIEKLYGSCDLEIGGTDQTFNMLFGRDVMKWNRGAEQAVLSMKIIEGTDGKEKMSKSLANYIGIAESPTEIFGKVMSIPDSSIANYFELCTFTPLSEIEKMKEKMANSKINPRDPKIRLAHEITVIYHGEDAARAAEENFINVFQKKELPENIPEIQVKAGEFLADLLLNKKIIKSKSEFSRLVDEGAIENLETHEKIKDYHYKIEKNLTLKIGKKRFLKITLWYNAINYK